MKQNDLLFSFILATVALIFRTALFPNIPIYPYVPFLVILILQARYLPVLWIAALCGVIVDLISTTHFGYHALSYFLAALLLYRQKRFFNDKPVNICLFTLIASIAVTFVEFTLMQLMQKQFYFSLEWFVKDLIVMPFFDLIYALFWFVIPLTFLQSLKKNWLRFKTSHRR